jgi:hypothetical protein
VNGDAAILDFTCPGTVANQYKLCRSATDAGDPGLGEFYMWVNQTLEFLSFCCLYVVCAANSNC